MSQVVESEVHVFDREVVSIVPGGGEHGEPAGRGGRERPCLPPARDWRDWRAGRAGRHQPAGSPLHPSLQGTLCSPRVQSQVQKVHYSFYANMDLFVIVLICYYILLVCDGDGGGVVTTLELTDPVLNCLF